MRFRLVLIIAIFAGRLLHASAAETLTRYYIIPPDIAPGQFANTQESNDLARINRTRSILRSTPEAIRALFKNNDAELPVDCTVHYSAEACLLSLAAPQEIHHATRQLLRRLNVLPVMIRLDFAHIVFKRSEIEKIAMRTNSGVATPSEVIALWRSGKGRSEISSTMSAASGVNAQFQSVQEIFYPSFDVDMIPLKQPSTNTVMCNPATPNDSDFDVRQVGWIINVTATSCENLDDIDVVIAPEVTWPLDENWKKAKSFTRPPIFSTRQLFTHVRVKSGVPWVAGGFREIPSDDISYFIVTCTAENPGD